MADVETRDDGLVRTITLNRPERRNALGPDLMAALEGVLHDTMSWSAGQVVVIEGAGPSFCAGANIKLPPEPSPTWQERRLDAQRWDRLIDTIESLPQITIARLHGHVVGGGAVIALACDLRVAHHDVTISLPELLLGLPLTMGGIPRLIREIGMSRARELVLLGRTMLADEAHAAGLVHRVGDSVTETASLVRQALAVPAPIQSITKRAFTTFGRAAVPSDASWIEPDLLVLTRLAPETHAAMHDYVAELNARRHRATHPTTSPQSPESPS